MNKSIRKQAISGLIWSFFDRFGSLLILLITNILMAQILSPYEFGLIGILMVFISISNTLIEGGFGSALIQKKEINDADASSLFYVNLFVAIICFLLLFFLAPYIAVFFGNNILNILLKVLSISLIFNSFGIVQNSMMIRSFEFKLLTRINLLSNFIACVVSIFAAYNGYGVWSLIIQTILISLLRSIFLWYWSEWRLQFIFVSKSAKEMFKYSYKLVLSGLADSVYTNIFSVIIGKRFSTTSLGYYNQAKKMSDTPVYTLSAVISQVTFPIFSQLQNDKIILKQKASQINTTLSFISFPLMILLIIIAKPLFIIIFTEKWFNSISLFQLLCLSGMFITINSVNLNILKSIGRTDSYLKSEIIKKIVGIIALLIGLNWGIKGIILSMVFQTYVSFVISSLFSGKVINYGFKAQFTDIFPQFILAVLVGIPIYFLPEFLFLNNFVMIIVQTSLYISFYVGISQFINKTTYDLVSNIIKCDILKIKK